MKIEIKNVKINNSFSEETICFTADIFVDGKKTGYARNDGHGGDTYCTSYHKPNNEHDFRQAVAYAKTLPSTSHEFMDKTMVLESNLESLVDDAVYALSNKKEAEKFEKKIQKACETSIVWGVPNSGNFQAIYFKGKPKLNDLANTIQGIDAIKKLVEKVKKEMKDGEVILNKDIPNIPHPFKLF